MTARGKPDTIEVERVPASGGYRSRGDPTCRSRRRVRRLRALSPALGFAVLWYGFLVLFGLMTWQIPSGDVLILRSFVVLFAIVGCILHVVAHLDGSTVRLTPALFEDEAHFIAETLREHLGLPT